ncbi:alpha/beta fold hydrolase [Spirosoma spitsbergense]|uniref:alpha/beta fold hydrolase n=1 Tax=Spirosoma spitsbergense TaxID=431554 RepID=UPI000363694C|nr:alpha/beta hydrolase [Spirosoma spitsbergense]
MSKGRVQKFSFDGSVIAYRKLGAGPAILVAFHGFGQSGGVFMPLERSLTSQFTIFAVDLFFHGNSEYNKNQLLTRPNWYRLMDAFLRTQGITRFSLMGFSLGGRFALTTLEAFAERIDQLFLMAPDGITQNVWYRLATTTTLGRKLFWYVLQHLPLLLNVGHILVKLGLLERGLMRFAELSLGTPNQWTLAYQSWTQFRQIQPNLVTIANLINSIPIRVHFFTGVFDQIVPGPYILPLTGKLRQYEWTNLEARHNQLIDLAGIILRNAG